MNRLSRTAVILLLLTGRAALAQQPAQTKQPSASSYGQAIFSRDASTPETNATRTGSPLPGRQNSTAMLPDSERSALTYTSYDFEVHLVPKEHSIAVRARMLARNDSSKPLGRLALQISSSLHWDSISVDGKAAKFEAGPLDSDIDHTGKLSEAIVALEKPLAPGAAVHLDVLYSGTIQQSSERLLRIGAPANVAASSEWDTIEPGFTALRGFGNVIWFPVSTAPVLLGQGARMFDSVGKWKLRETNAALTMRVLVEYETQKPQTAFLNGYVVRPDRERGADPSTEPPQTTDIPRVESFTLPQGKLGFSPLSLILTSATEQHFSGIDIYARHDDEGAAAAYARIAAADRPVVEQYLGSKQQRPVVLADLPDSSDLPFEDRNILLLPLAPNPASDSAGPVLAHMLSHAYFVSPRPWLDEGVAQLVTLLWIEQRAGRAAAIAQMESRRAALALAETSDPGIDPGQNLISAWSDIFYRDKAADVLWMLRDIAGERPLARALQEYRATDDRQSSYLQQLLQKASGKDLEWFFDDWVYRDRGLPDLHIASAYRRPIMTKNSTNRNFLVSAEVQNDSFCSAEVPVTVESESNNQTKRLLIPAHGRAALRFLMEGKPARVLVNDGSVPEVRTSHHEEAITAAQ